MKALLAVVALAAGFLPLPAMARDDGRFSNSPYKQWFEAQHNALGQSCCNQADAEPYFGDYTLNPDGSATLQIEGGPQNIEAGKVLKGTNPTGHAIWWHTAGYTWCFIPGEMG